MRRWSLLLLVLLLGVPTSGARAAGPDPAARGRLTVVRVTYNAGTTVLGLDPTKLSLQPIPAQLAGSIHLPTNARGRVPVVLLLHGRHPTCDLIVIEAQLDPCFVGSIPSYAGYDYLASHLASHGFLVMSIDANGVNGWDAAEVSSGLVARAQLISRSLDLLADWNSTGGPDPQHDVLRNRVDLRRLGLVGHGRGGEAVSYWPTYNSRRTDGPRYAASAIFAVAPTDIDDQVVTRIPYGTLLPLCDGDVNDLSGARVYERSKYASPGDAAPKHQLAVEGANHNWFNTVWEEDDADGTVDTACDPPDGEGIRLTAAQQQRVGMVVVSTFIRRYVGGDRRFDPLLAGSVSWRAACSGRMRVPCDELMRTSYHPPSAQRWTLLRPGTDLSRTADGGRAEPRSLVEYVYCDDATAARCPHVAGDDPRRGNRSVGPQVNVAWKTRSSLTLRPGRGTLDVRRFGALVLRTAVNLDLLENPKTDGRRPRSAIVPFDVVLTDRDGRTATQVAGHHGTALALPIGNGTRNMVLTDVRLALHHFAGVDLGAITTVTLRFGTRSTSGSIQLADVAFVG